MTFLIRDNTQVFNEVSEPGAIMDVKTGTLLKIGEYEVMEEYWEFMRKQYINNGFRDMADDIMLVQLPKNQEIIDKVFNISDYIGTLYKKGIP